MNFVFKKTRAVYWKNSIPAIARPDTIFFYRESWIRTRFLWNLPGSFGIKSVPFARSWIIFFLILSENDKADFTCINCYLHIHHFLRVNQCLEVRVRVFIKPLSVIVSKEPQPILRLHCCLVKAIVYYINQAMRYDSGLPYIPYVLPLGRVSSL